MSAFNRRVALKGALASAAVPAVIPGCVIAPAAAAICAAAPYIPDAAGGPDAKLLEYCARFRSLTKADAAVFERYSSMPIDAPEAKALAAEFDERYEAWAAAADACYATPPQTPAGAAAFLDIILTRDADFIDDAVLVPLRLLRDSLAALASA